MHRISHNRRTDRRGAILIVVMVCLVAIAVLAGTLLRLAVAQHRQARLQERQLQAEQLASAALDRAVRRLARQPEWTGETWKLADDVLGEPAAAVVQVRPADDGTTAHEISAAASVGGGELPPVRVTRVRRAAASAGGTP